MTWRILIVDDELHIRRALQQWFEMSGFDVDTAEDGKAAVAKCAENHYDIITMDLEMPRMKGHEALEAIQELQPDTPAIVVTGYSECLKKKPPAAVKVLSKPLSLAELEREVREVLEADS